MSNNTITRTLGGKLVTMTLVKIEPSNGAILYHCDDNGRNYILSNGRLRRAEMQG